MIVAPDPGQRTVVSCAFLLVPELRLSNLKKTNFTGGGVLAFHCLLGRPVRDVSRALSPVPRSRVNTTFSLAVLEGSSDSVFFVIRFFPM